VLRGSKSAGIVEPATYDIIDLELIVAFASSLSLDLLS